MDKLGLDYYCFHDVDIAPEGATLAESLENFRAMVGYIRELQERHGKKCLWVTANNFGDKKFMAGAATSCCADVFAVAAAKVRACIDAAIELGASGYVFWGGREGYETLLNTDMGLELDNLARFLAMARDYGRAHGFTGDFYIEPKPKEPTKHQYDFDVATCMNFLRKYGLTGDFKMNIEANHATLAGHTFQHELRMAIVNGSFGSIDANQGDLFLGWDTDQFPTNIYDTTFCMLEVLRAGGFTNGGLNFDAKTRRPFKHAGGHPAGIHRGHGCLCAWPAQGSGNHRGRQAGQLCARQLRQLPQRCGHGHSRGPGNARVALGICAGTREH